MQVAVHDIKGKETTKKVDLKKDIFGVEPNDHSIYLDIKHYLANQRRGTSKTKERGEIIGSRRKIRRQKGSGMARVGDIKNPIFRGGGRTFGPKPRDYDNKINKKVDNYCSLMSNSTPKTELLESYFFSYNIINIVFLLILGAKKKIMI